jgi:hypothetical protein
VIANRYKISFIDHGNFLKSIVVMVVQLCEYADIELYTLHE